jgi:hypothetical protein
MTSKSTPPKSSEKERAEMHMNQAIAAVRRLRRRVRGLPDGEAKDFYMACIRDVSTGVEIQAA